MDGVFSLRVSFPTISSLDHYVDRRGKNFFSLSTVTPQLLSHVSETKFSVNLTKVQSVDEKLLILDISPPKLLGETFGLGGGGGSFLRDSQSFLVRP